MENKPADRKILDQVGNYLWQKGAFSRGVYRSQMQSLGHSVGGNNGESAQDRTAPLALNTLGHIEEQLTNELDQVRKLKVDLAVYVEKIGK